MSQSAVQLLKQRLKFKPN